MIKALKILGVRQEPAELRPLDQDNSPDLPPQTSMLVGVLHYSIPFLIFCAFFNINILNPTRVAWLLDGDWGQHFLGWHAYRQAPLTFPYNYENLLANPTGLTLIYTDSNPLLAMPLRFISGALPRYFQYVGLWFLACVCLHYAIAYRWVARYASSQWTAIAGATLLTLLPTLYNRIGHDTLCAHWLILATLYTFFEIRDERRKLIAYAITLFLTAMVHPYLLFMNLAVWSGDVIRRALPLLRSKRWQLALRAISGATLSLIPALAGLAIAGAFSGQSAASDGFGVYGMPLDAIFNPGRDGFALAFLKGPQPPLMQFEGFQYLGFGLLVLFGAAVFARYRLLDSQTTNAVLDRARPLFWPFVALTLLAVSDHIFLYQIKILDLSFPTAIVDVLNIVRASGRLFWPVAYGLVFLALLHIYKTPQKFRNMALTAAMALQVLDGIGFANATRSLTHGAQAAQTFSVTPSAKWDALMEASHRVSYMAPILGREHRPFYETVLHALDHKRPVNMMYAARENPIQNARQRQEYFDFLDGRIDRSQLYILLNKSVPENLAGQVRELDGMWIIPPASASKVALATPSIPGFELGREYFLGFDTPTGAWFGADWSLPQSDSMVSVGESAVLALPYLQQPGQRLSLALTLRTRRKDQRVQVYIRGKKLADTAVGKSGQTLVVDVPAVASASHIVVTLIGVPTPSDRKRGKTAGVQLYNLRLSLPA